MREAEREGGGYTKILITFSDANDTSLVIMGLFWRHKFQFVSRGPSALLRTRRTGRKEVQ